MKVGSGRGVGGIERGAYPGGANDLDSRVRAVAVLVERRAEVGSRPLGRIDVDLDPGPELEAGPDRQPGEDVDVPAELLGAARRRADPEVELRRAVEGGGEADDRVAEHRRADSAVGLERGRGPAGDHPQLEWRSRGPR